MPKALHSILIIEDDRDLRRTISEILDDEGYDTQLASDGAEALRLLDGGYMPSMILLDIMMPVMDGWQFHAQLRQRAAFAGVPVVVFTADGHPRTKAERMGANGFLRKPPSMDSLLDVVKRFCDARQPEVSVADPRQSGGA